MQATRKELCEIFDCEANHVDVDYEQPYSALDFETVTGEFHLKLRVYLPVSEFKFQALKDGIPFLDLQAPTGTSLRAEVRGDKKLLIIGDSDSSKTVIRIKPDFFVGHQIES